MYAIVSIAGQQFKVEKGKKVFVHKLPGEIGDEVSFDKILLTGNDDKVSVGAPYLPDTVVYAQIVSQLRGDKVLVFKKKRRKGYQKLNGHRQYFTEILIEDIAEAGAPKKSEKKKAVEPKAETAPEVAATVEKAVKAEKGAKAEKAPAAKAAPKKAAPKASGEEKPKKAAPKKAAATSEKKPAAKKPAAKKPAAKTEGKTSKK